MRTELKLTIEDMLDTGLLRAYDKPLFEHARRNAESEGWCAVAPD